MDWGLLTDFVKEQGVRRFQNVVLTISTLFFFYDFYFLYFHRSIILHTILEYGLKYFNFELNKMFQE